MLRPPPPPQARRSRRGTAEFAKLKAEHEDVLKGVKDSAAFELKKEREARAIEETQSKELAFQVADISKRVETLSKAETVLKVSLDQALAVLEKERAGFTKERTTRLEVERRTEELHKHVAELGDKLASAQEREDKVQNVVASLQHELEKEVELYASDRAERFREIAELTRVIGLRDESVSNLKQILLGVVKSFSTLPVERSISSQLLPARRRQAQLKHFGSMLVEAGGIDVSWYRARNADISAEGMDPAIHFILHGVFEGRAPLPNFVES